MKFDEFEKMIITDIIEQYPEYKQKLQSQFEKLTVQKREFSTYVFILKHQKTKQRWRLK